MQASLYSQKMAQKVVHASCRKAKGVKVLTRTEQIFALQNGEEGIDAPATLRLNVEAERLKSFNASEMIYEIKLIKRDFLVELFQVFN